MLFLVLFSLLLIISNNPINAQEIFVPLDKDFVLFDLDKGQISYQFNYSKNPFGIRPVISDDGKFLYFTKEYQRSEVLYRREIATGQDIRFEMPIIFNTFKLLDQSRVILDNTRVVNLIENNFQQEVLHTAHLIRLVLSEQRANTLLYGEETFTIGDRQGELLEGYFLVREGLVLYNMFFANDKEPWQAFYQWFTFDPISGRSQQLSGLRGYARFNQGGAIVGVKPEVSYVKKS